MANRTDVTTVKAIMDTALTNDEITPMIAQANRVVTRILGGTTLTAEELEDIETYLTAHLIAIGPERQPQEEKVGDIWLTFQEKPKAFLESTTYGQMVLFLDSTGLMQVSTKKKITFTAIKQIQD